MDLKVFAVSLLLQFFNTAFVTANVEPSCGDTVRGRSCSLPSIPEHTALIGDRLFVGVSNELLAFEVSNLQFTDRVDLSPTQSELDACEGLIFRIELCHNFIRVIEPVPATGTTHPQCGDLSDKILVCGTRAYAPKCRFHARTNLSDSCSMTENQEDQGFSPYLNERRNAGVLASNGRFYSGTFFTSIGTHRTIGMAPRPLVGDGEFTVQTPDLPWWLRDPEFISTYEIGDHIYFFLREPAYEIDMGRSVVYSRAVRFCKNDPGIDASSSNVDVTFLTLQKARMKCTNGGSTNSLPYDYDNLKATFLFAPEGENGEKTLYGAFSSPDNAPPGAAICKFSFDNGVPGSLGAVFEDGQYFAPIFTTPGTLDGSDFELQNEAVFSCPGSGGTQRDPADAEAHQLVFNPATPLDPQPIHTISGSEYTQIAVDKFTYNGEEYEILYFGLNTGMIGQFVSGPSGTFEYQIDNIGNSVSDLLIRKEDSTGSRYLYATTNDSVISIVLGDCSRYTDCFKCFDSRDPYCAWNPDSNTCVNLLAVSGSLLDSVSSTEDVIVATCGDRPSMPTPEPTRPPSTCPSGFVPQSSQPQPSSTPQSTPENEGSSGCMPSTPEQPSDNASPSTSSTDQPSDTSSTTGTNTDTPTVDTAGVKGSSTGSDFSIVELVGASLGGVVVGIPVGLVICAVFFFIKKKGSGESRTTATHLESGTRSVNHVNNQLDQHVQKKQEQINQQDHRYVEPTKLGTPQHHMQKNVNEYEAEEDDDDVLPELPPNGMFNGTQHSTNQSRTAPRVLHKPPASSRTRNRTESTRHLFSSLSSEPSESSGSSPLDSPA